MQNLIKVKWKVAVQQLGIAQPCLYSGQHKRFLPFISTGAQTLIKNIIDTYF